MKTNRIIKNLAALALLATFNSQLSTAFAQGSLTPPGAPAPTMKSADQIEPRTIVNAVNTPGNANNLFIITNSGSYYLTTNLVGVSGKNGIEILTNNVTLDLNGFAMQGVSDSPDGIYIQAGQTNITVRNGTISGWFNVGVYGEAAPGSSVNLVFERLNVSDGFFGITINGTGVVCDCNCQNTAYGGIDLDSGTVSECSVQNTLNGTGIEVDSGTVSGCTADNNGVSGIRCGGIISGCTADNNGEFGIYVGSGTVSGCFVRNNKYSGIIVNGSGSIVIGNTCIGNNTGNSSSDAGIYIGTKNTRVEDNHVTASGYAGIAVASGCTNNIIIKNSVSGNGANNYSIPAGQVFGPLITNTVSGIITNSNPWANFSF